VNSLESTASSADSLLGIGLSNLSGEEDLLPYWEQLPITFLEKFIP
jgi:hypothetical protein